MRTPVSYTDLIGKIINKVNIEDDSLYLYTSNNKLYAFEPSNVDVSYYVLHNYKSTGLNRLKESKIRSVNIRYYNENNDYDEDYRCLDDYEDYSYFT